MNSTAVGSHPHPSTWGTALMQASRSSNGTSRDRFTFGSGISFTVSRVRIPRVPSEPIIRSIRLYPEEVFTFFPPSSRMLPSASTTCMPST